MALTYLSGDFDAVGKRKKTSGGGGGGGGSKRRTGGAGNKRVKKTKVEKKQARKRVFKKVKKVAIAPARVAFLTVTRLNALKIATMMARVWNAPNGKDTLTKFWQGFGGDINKLKENIAKGSKQAINADDIGSTLAATIATATPIIVALAPIFKQFKVARTPKEAQDFDKGMEQGRKDLAEDSEVPESTVSMPKNKEAGIVADKEGNSTESSAPEANKPETETGGQSESGGGSSDESETATNGKMKNKQQVEAEKTMANNFSPLGFNFMLLMYLMLFQVNNVFTSLLGTFALINLLLIPLATSKPSKAQRIAYAIVYKPFNYLQTLIYLKWQKA